MGGGIAEKLGGGVDLMKHRTKGQENGHKKRMRDGGDVVPLHSQNELVF